MEGISLTQGKPWKVLLSFMFPIFAGLLLQQLYNTVDTIVVGNFAGERPLAAVGACGVLTMAALALANGFSAGAGILVAQYFGAGKEGLMRRQASSAIILMLAMGLLTSFAGIFFSRFALTHILFTPQSLLEMSVTYFTIYAGGLIFQFGYNVVAAILRGIGDSRATLYFLLVASGVNVILDIVFIYNFQMNVAGAAIATDIAQGASCLAAFLYMTRKYPQFRWKWKELSFEPQLAAAALKTGFPMALQQFIVSIGFVFIQRAVNSYGEAMTAAFAVAQRIESYMILPANALMVTQGNYTGQNLGACRMDRVTDGAKTTVILSELISLCISITAFVFAQPLVSLFGLEEEAVSYGTSYVQCVAVCLVIFAGYFPLLGLFQGANDAFYATLVATVALAIRVASTYILQDVPWLSYRMIWWNTLFGWSIGCIITWIHFLRGKWKPQLSSAATTDLLS